MSPTTDETGVPAWSSEELRRAVKASMGVAAFAGLLSYVLAPLLAPPAVLREPISIPDPPSRLHANLIDCFILRDASGSADSSRYGAIEKAILSTLRLNAGDRVTYATFGTDTRPNPIVPPSADRSSLESQRRLAQEPRFATTNFPLLFTRLRETITRDRQASLATQRHMPTPRS